MESVHYLTHQHISEVAHTPLGMNIVAYGRLYCICCLLLLVPLIPKIIASCSLALQHVTIKFVHTHTKQWGCVGNQWMSCTSHACYVLEMSRTHLCCTEWSTHCTHSNLHLREPYVPGFDLNLMWTHPSVYIVSVKTKLKKNWNYLKLDSIMNTGSAHLEPLMPASTFWNTEILMPTLWYVPYDEVSVITWNSSSSHSSVTFFYVPGIGLRIQHGVQTMSSMAPAISDFEPLDRFSRNSVW
jgi:hypothetical protein